MLASISPVPVRKKTQFTVIAALFNDLIRVKGKFVENWETGSFILQTEGIRDASDTC